MARNNGGGRDDPQERMAELNTMCDTLVENVERRLTYILSVAGAELKDLVGNQVMSMAEVLDLMNSKLGEASDLSRDLVHPYSQGTGREPLEGGRRVQGRSGRRVRSSSGRDQGASGTGFQGEASGYEDDAYGGEGGRM